MKKLLSSYLCLAAVLNLAFVPDVLARGGRGGGGGGGGARGGGGMSRPSGGGMSRGPTMSRPSMPSSRPAPRPSAPSRPTARPSTPRPSTPRPSQPIARPGTGGSGFNRPGGGSGITNRPGTSNPGIANRPGAGNLPANGNRPGAGNRPAQRPSSSDLGNFLNLPENGGNVGNRAGDRAANVGNRAENMQGRADNRGEWRSQLSDNVSTRQSQRQDWADGVRGNWQDNQQNRQDFRNEIRDEIGEPGWRFEYPHLAHGYYHYNHPYAHGWWTACTAAALTGWWTSGWGEPVYYDYGSGGNVYYEDEAVYVDGQAAATTEEYADQASDIAQNGAEQLASPIAMKPDEEWLPLGVFALSTSAEDKNPTKYFQLAVSKEGVISGTFINTATNQNLPIQGAVDKKTQRASWFVGDKKDTVMETGIYNLTKDQASALVHFGTERTEEYLLVRMDPPPDASQPAAAATQE